MRDLDAIGLTEEIRGEAILPREVDDREREAGDPDQPPGITSDSLDLPPLVDAAKRVRAFLEVWGDGRIDEMASDDTPLFARDLEVVSRYVDGRIGGAS